MLNCLKQYAGYRGTAGGHPVRPAAGGGEHRRPGAAGGPAGRPGPGESAGGAGILGSGASTGTSVPTSVSIFSQGASI